MLDNPTDIAAWKVIDGKSVPPSNVVCFDAAEKPLDKAPSDCDDVVGEMAP